MSTIANILVIFILLVGLYYLYQYIYGGAQTPIVLNLIPSTIIDANPTSAIMKKVSIPIASGGEMSFEGWIYIRDYSTKMNQNKHLFTLGGNTFDTLRIYLAPTSSDLRVRVTSQSTGMSNTPSQNPVAYNEYLVSTKSNEGKTFFTGIQVEDLLSSALPMCDVKSLDLQRWIHIVVTMNNRSVDTYIDGKLARSCVLPTFFKVENIANLEATVLAHGGFGGKVANFNLYSLALPPDEIYHKYMAGPNAPSSLSEYLKSFFVPSDVSSTYSY
jgi:hypothetical protein